MDLGSEEMICLRICRRIDRWLRDVGTMNPEAVRMMNALCRLIANTKPMFEQIEGWENPASKCVQNMDSSSKTHDFFSTALLAMQHDWKDSRKP